MKLPLKLLQSNLNDPRNVWPGASVEKDGL